MPSFSVVGEVGDVRREGPDLLLAPANVFRSDPWFADLCLGGRTTQFVFLLVPVRSDAPTSFGARRTSLVLHTPTERQRVFESLAWPKTESSSPTPPHHSVMSLRVAIAAPFKGNGKTRLREQAFVVDLAIDRNWVSPDQAKRLLELGVDRGLLRREDGEVVATVDLDSITVPDRFTPDSSIFDEQVPFEEILDTLVEAGHDRQESVAAINSLQTELLVTADTAAVLYARQEGLDVESVASRVERSLRS